MDTNHQWIAPGGFAEIPLAMVLAARTLGARLIDPGTTPVTTPSDTPDRARLGRLRGFGAEIRLFTGLASRIWCCSLPGVPSVRGTEHFVPLLVGAL